MSHSKPIVLILKGLPASGKSTFARALISEQPGHYKRVNKDELRSMLDDDIWSPVNERFILKVRDQLILQAIQAGFNVIVDDTNLHPKHEQAIRRLVGDQATVEVKFFDVSIDEAIQRDKDRTDHAVGPDVIRNMQKRFLSKP